MNEIFDFCIVITTYNRVEPLFNLLNQIENQKKNYKIKLFIFDDNSDEKYDVSKFNATKINIFPNRGKRNFWLTIDQSFKTIKNIDSRYYLYLQDDLILTENFFEKVVYMYENLKDEKKICLEFRTDDRTTRTNWSKINPTIMGDYIKTQWVELDFICEKKFFEVLNYKMDPIPKDRWDKDPNLSSGVGYQLTIRLLEMGYNLFHTKNTLVTHGKYESIMNINERKKNKLVTN
jgi:glycosyltransferase involved in cell wall biosynthesis